MNFTILGAFTLAGLIAVFVVAPLMYSAAALVRSALWKRKQEPSDFMLALLPALAELFLALSFTAGVAGSVHAFSANHPSASGAWLWMGSFFVAALPGVIRWTIDFLADPGGDPAPLPAWLETPVVQPAVFVLFAAVPKLSAAVAGWTPFVRGFEHPVWTSAVVAGLGILGLTAMRSLRSRVRFVPLPDGAPAPVSRAAGSGR
jgi:hypothetical protein